MNALLRTSLSVLFMPGLKPATVLLALQVIAPDARAPPPPPVLPVLVSGARIVPRTIIVEPSPPPPAFFLKQVRGCTSHLSSEPWPRAAGI